MYVIRIIRLAIPVEMSVVVYTDLSAKEPHTQGKVVKSGNLESVMVNTLTRNAGHVGSFAL